MSDFEETSSAYQATLDFTGMIFRSPHFPYSQKVKVSGSVLAAKKGRKAPGARTYHEAMRWS
jgi:hypothetical protein